MKWIKISERVPEFDKVVLLLAFSQNKSEKNHECEIGYLKLIDKDGYHFARNGISMDDIFGFNKTSFIPTHWCEIELPIEE